MKISALSHTRVVRLVYRGGRYTPLNNYCGEEVTEEREGTIQDKTLSALLNSKISHFTPYSPGKRTDKEIPKVLPNN